MKMNYLRVIEITNLIPENEFRKCFDIWIERMKKCRDIGGDWFEFKKRGGCRNK